MSSLQTLGAPPVGCPQLHIHCHPTFHMRTAQISCCHSLQYRSLASSTTDKVGLCNCGHTERHNSGNFMCILTWQEYTAMLQGLKKGSADYCGSSNTQQADERRHKQPMSDCRVHIYQSAICMPNNLNSVFKWWSMLAYVWVWNIVSSSKTETQAKWKQDAVGNICTYGGGHTTLHNEELHNLYCSPTCIKAIKYSS